MEIEIILGCLSIIWSTYLIWLVHKAKAQLDVQFKRLHTPYASDELNFTIKSNEEEIAELEADGTVGYVTVNTKATDAAGIAKDCFSLKAC